MKEEIAKEKREAEDDRHKCATKKDKTKKI